MGEAIAGLVDHELSTVVTEADANSGSVYAGRAEEWFDARESQLTVWERHLTATQQRLRGCAERLSSPERELGAWERRLEIAGKLRSSRASDRKVGRDERCPSRSGRKYKPCHGAGSWGR